MLKSKFTHINQTLLEDLGFIEINESTDCYEVAAAEQAFRHPSLDPKNLILVDYKNGGWHFAQRKHAINGIGKMTWLDDLVIGFEFVTGEKLLK